jgi:thiamine transport system permease protein
VSRFQAAQRLKIGLWLLPLVYLGLFFFYPLGAILSVSFDQAGSVLATARTWVVTGRVLGFTMFQALLSTGLTVLVGFPAAYLFARMKFPGKGVLRLLTTLPFILPTVVAAAGFNALLGPRGWVNLGLMSLLGLQEAPIHILNTLGAILLAHVFYNTSVMARVVGSAWAGQDAHLEQAARMLGASGWRVFREVTLPLLRPALTSALLLVFLFNFSSFGVILMLGGPRFATLEVEIYTQALHMLNLPLAGLLSLIQLGFTLLISAFSGRLGSGGAAVLPDLRQEGSHTPKGWPEIVFVWGLSLTLVVLLASPLAALVARSLWVSSPGGGMHIGLDFYTALFTNRLGGVFYVAPVVAVRNSLVYAGATVAISLTLGLAATAALRQKYHSGSQPSMIQQLYQALVMLPLGASAVTLGLGFVVVFNHPPLLLARSGWIIPVAHSLVAMPFVVRTLQPAWEAIPRAMGEVSATLGANPWRAFWEVTLPLLSRPLLVAAMFAFAISLGEFGASSFLARPDFPTLPVAVFRYLAQPGEINYGQALAMANILLLVCAGCIVVMERVKSRQE